MQSLFSSFHVFVKGALTDQDIHSISETFIIHTKPYRQTSFIFDILKDGAKDVTTLAGKTWENPQPSTL